MTDRLNFAITEARKIRRNLIKHREFGYDLSGACGLASVILANKLNDVKTLRWHEGPNWSHVYNVVDGTIVDITATQFNHLLDVDKRCSGVYVGKTPQSFHAPVESRGLSVYRWMVEDWTYDHRTWHKITNSWIQL